MLESLIIFFGNDPKVLQSVKAASTVVSYSPGSTILSQEDNTKTVYCLLTGTAKVLMFSEDGDEIWLDEFGPGSLFGEMAVLGAKNRTADIVASTKVSAAAFSEENWLALMEKHGSIGICVARLLVERIQQTTRRMFELSALSARGRVCAELLRMAEVSEDGTLVIMELPSFISFAQRIGSTRETVSRTVNHIERQGFAKRQGKKMVILNPEEVKALQYR